jgi:hypothetical protein
VTDHMYNRRTAAGRRTGTIVFRHTLHWVRIPISCSLEQSDAQSQLAEWQGVLRQVVYRSERVSPNRLELKLIPDSEIAPVIRLAQREVACCPFFTFTFEIGADGSVLAVDVPDDAIEILDHLAANVC